MSRTGELDLILVRRGYHTLQRPHPLLDIFENQLYLFNELITVYTYFLYLYNFNPIKGAVWHVPFICTTCGGYRQAILLFRMKSCVLDQIFSEIHQVKSPVFQEWI